MPSPSNIESWISLLKFGEIGFEARGVYAVDGQERHGPIVSGQLTGRLIKVSNLASTPDAWSDWTELNLDLEPKATVTQDWMGAQAYFVGGDLEAMMNTIIRISPLGRVVQVVTDPVKRIRETTGAPEGKAAVLRIRSHMKRFSSAISWTDDPRALFIAAHIPSPQLPGGIQKYLGELPAAEFRHVQIESTP